MIVIERPDLACTTLELLNLISLQTPSCLNPSLQTNLNQIICLYLYLDLYLNMFYISPSNPVSLFDF